MGMISLPMLQRLQKCEPLLWLNPAQQPAAQALAALPLGVVDIQDAEQRLGRFAPLLQRLFPELEASAGLIESPLVAVPSLQRQFRLSAEQGRLYLKADHLLPVAGSIKARGGIYEVLVFAEKLALREGILRPADTYTSLADPQARQLFQRYTVAVGSTGNLGLSIGVMAAALGFRAVVHMAADAKAWKKQRLREQGVEVVEHSGDYSQAVSAGRAQAAQAPHSYFVDDENSQTLFLGYSVAALRLTPQLAQANLLVDAEHPLFVYLPCGVGGAPGGITFGLKQIFGDHVHCFFAEPVASPCMLVQMLAGAETTSVYEVGLDNRTDADGLAVATASRLAARFMPALLAGIFTMTDDDLFRNLYWLAQTEQMKIEPSAAAGFPGPGLVLNSPAGQRYIQERQLASVMKNATHLLWTTGGLLLPDAEHERFWLRGKALAR